MKDRVSIALASSLLALVVFGVFFATPAHPVFPWHDVPGYMAVIGFLGCIVVVLIAKSIGKKFLQRPEDYDDN